MWIALSLIAAASLIYFWRGPNAVWGGIAGGAVGGLVAETFWVLIGNAFSWLRVGKWIVGAVLIMTAIELIARFLSGRSN